MHRIHFKFEQWWPHHKVNLSQMMHICFFKRVMNFSEPSAKQAFVCFHIIFDSVEGTQHLGPIACVLTSELL